jgi:hypothetical protein
MEERAFGSLKHGCVFPVLGMVHSGFPGKIVSFHQAEDKK